MKKEPTRRRALTIWIESGNTSCGECPFWAGTGYSGAEGAFDHQPECRNPSFRRRTYDPPVKLPDGLRLRECRSAEHDANKVRDIAAVYSAWHNIDSKLDDAHDRTQRLMWRIGEILAGTIIA